MDVAYAAHRKLAAAVAWYGILDGQQSSVFHDVLSRYPTHPLDLFQISCKLRYSVYGGQDEPIPLPSIHDMQAALAIGSAEAHRSTSHIYPHAGHAFFADSRATYNESAATDAWRRCLAWLRDQQTDRR